MLPEKAKRVFEGILFDVYQWPQEMFDGSIETFEMLKRVDTAEIIAIKDGKIMLQEQEQPGKPQFLCLPGGRIEKDEEPLEGAKRELLEESGFVSDDWSLFHSVEPSHKMDWRIYVYVARDCRFIQKQNLDAGEKIQIRWVTLDELLDLIDSGQLGWIEQDFRVQCVRAKYHQPAKEELERKIFGSK